MKPDFRKNSHGPFRSWMAIGSQLHPYRIGRALLLTFVSTIILSSVMAIGTIDPDTHDLEQGAHLPYMIVINLMIFGVLYLYNFRLLRMRMKGAWLQVASMGGSLLMTAAFSVPAWWLEGAIYGSHFNNLMVNMAVNGTTALIASLISLLLHNVTLHQQALLENEHLQSENLRIHHETLERQVSPHFLFNSLNALDALIATNPAAAHRYLQQLAAIYRYVLQERAVVSLADELAFCRSYMEMMQTRYGHDALRIEERIDPALLGCQLPAISIQLLVENAIKHNVITPRRPLTVTIVSAGESLTVSNPKQPKEDESHPDVGLGLPNLSQRYRLLTGRDITIRDDGQTFSVEIPLIKSAEFSNHQSTTAQHV